VSCGGFSLKSSQLVFVERKLQPNEYPHNLYIQNYSTATSTCLCIRKWLFSISKELSLMNDTQATSYIFWQVHIASGSVLHVSLSRRVSVRRRGEPGIHQRRRAPLEARGSNCTRAEKTARSRAKWWCDDEGMAFCLKYNRSDKTPRWLKIFTPYVR
jgi:sorting nexin-27